MLCQRPRTRFGMRIPSGSWTGQSFAAAGLKAEGKFKAGEARYTAADEVNKETLRIWLAECRDVQWDYKNIVRRKGKLERLK